MPKKSDYRKFKIKTVIGPNDYASMKEVLTRRFEHGTDESSTGFNKLPDIILMDGGRGQVNICLQVLEEFKLNIPVCGMVKDEHHRTRALLVDFKEVPISTHGECFKFLTRVQDEVHRFAITFHRQLRSKNSFSSQLDGIEGLGPKRKQNLMKYFKSLTKIKEASVDEIVAVGIPRAVAEAVHQHLNLEEDSALAQVAEKPLEYKE